MVCSSAAPGYEAKLPTIFRHKKRRPAPEGTDLLLPRASMGYLDPRPNSVDFGSSALSTGPATAARAAVARFFGSVSPARYSAITAAIAARTYVLAIAMSLSLFIVTPLDWLLLSS